MGGGKPIRRNVRYAARLWQTIVVLNSVRTRIRFINPHYPKLSSLISLIFHKSAPYDRYGIKGRLLLYCDGEYQVSLPLILEAEQLSWN